MSNNTSPLQTRVWNTQEGTFTYPEQQAGVLLAPPASTGVCLSGGGNRALVAGLGQLRALYYAGLLDKTGYLSSVSGGSWACTPFTYYESGAANDAEFLGAETAPAQITVAGLDNLAKGNLGSTATKRFIYALVEESVEAALGSTPIDQIWTRSVGKVYLKPYGLFNDPRKYFSYSPATVADIQSRNPSLANAPFHTVRDKTGDAKRPYLVVNSSLVWPGTGVDNLVHFEYTPLTVGSQKALTVFDPPGVSSGKKMTVGGGFIEPFAFGSEAPAQWPPANGIAAVPPPSEAYALAYAAGASSAAYGQIDAVLAGLPQLKKYLQHLPPIETYWPLPPDASATPPIAGQCAFADGGSLENYGLIALLLRKVKNIVVFNNTARRLSLDYDPSDPVNDPPRISDMDGDLPTFFGVLPTHRLEPATPNNQVFKTSDFTTVIEALQNAKRAGGTPGPNGPWGPCVASTQLEVQPNSWWGVEGGWTANICWVYLDRVTAWESALQPDVAKLVDDGNSKNGSGKGPFADFPNYKTAFENGFTDLLHLSKPEVNLLADFTCWVAKESAGAKLIQETLQS